MLDAYQAEEISIGDYVLSGGEPAAMILLDACVRVLPDVLGNAETHDEESFENGLLEEVRGILASGYAASAKPFEAIAYKQCMRHLAGKITLDEAIADTQMETRRYAKRQWTWFRKDRTAIWFDGFGNDRELQEKVLQEVSEQFR